jgi:hypothetical protein
MQKRLYTFAVILMWIAAFLLAGYFDHECLAATRKSDTKLVQEYCHKHYPGKAVRIVRQENVREKTFLNRNGKRFVYVIKFKAQSHGNYGFTKNGSFIRFNKTVKKGKWVYVYYIYNPYSNYEDDVVARVGNRKIIEL